MINLRSVVPPLAPDEREDLKASIAKWGVLTPLVVDENGLTLDGFHRTDLFHELRAEGVIPPAAVLPTEPAPPGLTDEERVALAVALNVHRRHLTSRQRRNVAEELVRRFPHWSDGRIAERVKLDKKTVRMVRSDLEQRGDIEPTTERIGRDGLTQPAAKAPQNENRGGDSGHLEVEHPQPVAAPPQQPERDPLDRPIREPRLTSTKGDRAIAGVQLASALVSTAIAANNPLTPEALHVLHERAETFRKLLATFHRITTNDVNPFR